MKDDRTDAPSPPARPPQSPARLYSGHRRRHRSREQDCSRQPSHRGFPATASTAPDPPLQRSASSIPPQNHQENLSSARVFTHPGSNPAVAAASLVPLGCVRSSSDTLYGAIFVKGVPQGSYPFSRPSVSLFDLGSRFFVPTCHIRIAGARRSGQGWGALAPTEGSSLRASSTTAHLLWSG